MRFYLEKDLLRIILTLLDLYAMVIVIKDTKLNLENEVENVCLLDILLPRKDGRCMILTLGQYL